MRTLSPYPDIDATFSLGLAASGSVERVCGPGTVVHMQPDSRGASAPALVMKPKPVRRPELWILLVLVCGTVGFALYGGFYTGDAIRCGIVAAGYVYIALYVANVAILVTSDSVIVREQLRRQASKSVERASVAAIHLTNSGLHLVDANHHRVLSTRGSWTRRQVLELADTLHVHAYDFRKAWGFSSRKTGVLMSADASAGSLANTGQVHRRDRAIVHGWPAWVLALAAAGLVTGFILAVAGGSNTHDAESTAGGYLILLALPAVGVAVVTDLYRLYRRHRPGRLASVPPSLEGYGSHWQNPAG
jgi:hypothetical protein